jgi:hypothetical protein
VNSVLPLKDIITLVVHFSRKKNNIPTQQQICGNYTVKRKDDKLVIKYNIKNSNIQIVNGK